MKDELKIVLVTGAARRIGAQIAQTLHRAGMNVIVQYRQSFTEAQKLVRNLNDLRPDSAWALAADLSNLQELKNLAKAACSRWGHLDALVNNAAVFYPTPIASLKETQWELLINLNMKAPLFLSHELATFLAARQGCIVNISDVHAVRPLKGHTVYSASKAGLTMITQSLAKELAPAVRCNAVAPGAILWPEGDSNTVRKQNIVSRTQLKRVGHPEDIASAVLFLIRDANYITGQTLIVDGGRSLHN